MSASTSEGEAPAYWDCRYRILRTLGSGGLGLVMLAEDTLQPGRVVAIKRHRPEFQREIPQFLREFRIHRQLSHPNIPRAYELGYARDSGVLCPYFTMEVSPGLELLDLLAAGRALSRVAVMEVAVGLLRALDHVHRQGFVHADLKPSNILVSERDGRFHADLVDFGVAQPRGRTLGDELLVTPEYAAPEILEGALVEPRSDLYSLGLILYELLEGRRPWLESDVDALWRARNGSPPPMTAPEVPPSLSALVHRLLAPRPADRPASAAEVLTELSRATAFDVEIEPIEAFVQRLLTVPLPWRGWLERLAAEVTEDPLMPGAPFCAVVDVPVGFFARRLLGPVLDEASARRARVLPVRFDERSEVAPLIAHALSRVAAEERAHASSRPLVLVLENLDQADADSLDLLEAASNKATRIVATRLRPDILPPFLAQADDATRARPGVRIAPLPMWSEDEVKAWLHRALGRIGAPWEKADRPSGLPAPVTPASLVEHLAGLFREGRIARAGDGYTWRERGSEGARPSDERGRAEDVTTLLCAMRRPIPEGALGPYLAGRAADPAELLARGLVVARGDGTVMSGDPEGHRALYDSLAQPRRQRLHRRLAQALEVVGAPPHRVAEEWLDSDTPLLAVPHLLTAAEARPGRAWLDRSLALIKRARALVENWGEAEAAPPVRVGEVVRVLTGSGRRDRLDPWRYTALILATEARVLLATRVTEAREASAVLGEGPNERGIARSEGPVEQRIARLAELGADHGHRATIRVALDLQLGLAWARRDVAGLVAAAQSLASLDGEQGDAGARLHWARGLGLAAEGLPEEAFAELEAGLSLAGTGAVATSPALALLGQPAEARVALLEARASLSVESHWPGRAERACRELMSGPEAAASPRTRARVKWLEAVRLRDLGALDRALALIEEAARTLPRDRQPTLDAEVELELGRVRLELYELPMCLEHARFAAALAQDDRNRELEGRAAMLEAVARFYQGDLVRASMRAQEAVRLMGESGPGANDARLTVLELALATQGFTGSAAVMREAAELGWRCERRAERARAGRAFRLAAEAARLRRETNLALDWSQRALAEVDRIPSACLSRPRHFASAGRCLLLAQKREAAERLFASARAEVMAMALSIAESSVRERWLAHPDQRLILGLSELSVQAVAPAETHRTMRPGPEAAGSRMPVHGHEQAALLLAPMRP